MPDPRKLDIKKPKNTDLGVKRLDNIDNPRKPKGRSGQREALMKTKTVGPTVLKENLLLALEKSLGIVATACRAVGCSRDMHYYLMKNDPDYLARYNELSNVALDFVESRLFEKIRDKDSACIIFYLKTKGKERGYVEKIETEHSFKKADLTKLSEEELMQYANIQMKLDGESSATVL